MKNTMSVSEKNEIGREVYKAVLLVAMILLIILGKVYQNYRTQDERIQYRSILPSYGTTVSISVSEDREIDPRTLRPYLVAILKWRDDTGTCLCVVKEKDAKPSWFQYLLSHNGQTLALPPAEQPAPPSTEHAQPTGLQV